MNINVSICLKSFKASIIFNITKASLLSNKRKITIMVNITCNFFVNSRQINDYLHLKTHPFILTPLGYNPTVIFLLLAQFHLLLNLYS